MTVHTHLCSKVAGALALTLVGLATLTCDGATTKSPKASSTNAIPAVPIVEIPKSVFAPPSSPQEGRNPFFPLTAIIPPAATKAPEKPVDMSAFVLNGITSPPRRSAMINGSTFEPGEMHEVRLLNGTKALIKCEEIKTDSAVIIFDGLRRELHLRPGL